MFQTVRDYEPISDLSDENGYRAEGFSLAPKSLIFHILPDNSHPVQVLDIGFGVGQLGQLIKEEKTTNHWQIDGVISD